MKNIDGWIESFAVASLIIGYFAGSTILVVIGLILVGVSLVVWMLDWFFPIPPTMKTSPATNPQTEQASSVDENSPWAVGLRVPYSKYLAMRQTLLNDLKEFPNQDTPQFMGMGKSLSPKEMRDQVEAQTSVGKEFIQMHVEEKYGSPIAEKPISAAERVRGRQELIKWLESFISDGFGDKLMHLDFQEKRKPSEVLQGLTDQTEQGLKDLESYIMTNRKKWREHYSKEEFAAAKTEALAELSTVKDQDERAGSFNQRDYTYNELIQAINNEDKVGLNYILMMARHLQRKGS